MKSMEWQKEFSLFSIDFWKMISSLLTFGKHLAQEWSKKWFVFQMTEYNFNCYLKNLF